MRLNLFNSAVIMVIIGAQTEALKLNEIDNENHGFNEFTQTGALSQGEGETLFENEACCDLAQV